MSPAVRELIACADRAADELLDLAEEVEGMMEPGVVALYRDCANQLCAAVEAARAEQLA